MLIVKCLERGHWNSDLLSVVLHMIRVCDLFMAWFANCILIL